MQRSSCCFQLILPLQAAHLLESEGSPNLREDQCLYGNWCGPGHPKYDGLTGPGPIDGLDAACKRHDKCYRERGYMNCDCDLELLKDIDEMISQNYTAHIIYDYFNVAPCKGAGIAVKPFKAIKHHGEGLLEAGPMVYFVAKPIEIILGIGKTLLNSIGIFDDDK